MTSREAVLLRAALAGEALLNPGAVIEADVERLSAGHSQAEPVVDRLGPFVVRSVVEGTGTEPGRAPVRRTVRVEADGLARPDPTVGSGLRARLDRLALRSPLLGDSLKQRAIAWGLRRADRVITDRVSARDDLAPLIVPSEASRLPAVLVGMYWLEHGGAEKWALDTVRMIEEAGLHPVVVVDVSAAQTLAAHAVMRDATLLVVDGMSEAASEALTFALVRHFDIRGIVIHHSNWLYARLPQMRALLPSVPVVDSLHVVEWENGGFPMVSARYDAFIDQHHVIAPHLQRYLVEVKHVATTKVVVAPLLRLGAITAPAPATQPSAGSEHDGPLTPIRVGFVGRAVPQKRPLLFIELVAAAHRRKPRGGIQAVFHGDGPLVDDVRRLAERRGIAHLVEYRTSAVPVAETYADIDVLVISSQTEGLTLTTMEATRSGVLVISTDVGSQEVLVAPDLLLPREPIAFVRRASHRIRQLARSAPLRRRLLEEQRSRSRRLSELADAEVWFEQIASAWAIPVREE